MAFPYFFEANFEQGNGDEWDAVADTGTLLDFPHARELARFPWRDGAPFRGAYVARARLSGTTDVAFTAGDVDIADGSGVYLRFYMQLCPDFVATADDVVSLLKFRQASGGTVEQTVGLNVVAATGVVTIGAGDGTAAGTFGTVPLTIGKWHAIEVFSGISTADAGAITVWVDGRQHVALTDLDAAGEVGELDFGIMDRLATTTGTVLFDAVVVDDARVYPIVDRYPDTVLMTKSGHVFVGPGKLANVSLLGGTDDDCVLSVFDTAWGNTNDAYSAVLELKNVAPNDPIDPADMPKAVHRGCYVQLTGTNPRAMVSIGWAPAYSSPAAVRNVAARLRQEV